MCVVTGGYRAHGGRRRGSRGNETLYVEVSVPYGVTVEIVLPGVEREKTEVVGAGDWSFQSTIKREYELAGSAVEAQVVDWKVSELLAASDNEQHCRCTSLDMVGTTTTAGSPGAPQQTHRNMKVQWFSLASPILSMHMRAETMPRSCEYRTAMIYASPLALASSCMFRKQLILHIRMASFGVQTKRSFSEASERETGQNCGAGQKTDPFRRASGY